MDQVHFARLIRALRATLAEIEDASKCNPEDPALRDLRVILLRRISILQAEQEQAERTAKLIQFPES
jgi:hypothetical protein